MARAIVAAARIVAACPTVRSSVTWTPAHSRDKSAPRSEIPLALAGCSFEGPEGERVPSGGVCERRDGVESRLLKGRRARLLGIVDAAVGNGASVETEAPATKRKPLAIATPSVHSPRPCHRLYPVPRAPVPRERYRAQLSNAAHSR